MSFSLFRVFHFDKQLEKVNSLLQVLLAVFVFVSGDVFNHSPFAVAHAVCMDVFDGLDCAGFVVVAANLCGFCVHGSLAADNHGTAI